MSIKIEQSILVELGKDTHEYYTITIGGDNYYQYTHDDIIELRDKLIELLK